MPKLEKEKYYAILRSEGLSAAITALHRDQTQFEFETFEGQSGYDPEMWNFMAEVRDFSRELWEMAQNPATQSHR